VTAAGEPTTVMREDPPFDQVADGVVESVERIGRVHGVVVVLVE
jgi:hypothetical protein